MDHKKIFLVYEFSSDTRTLAAYFGSKRLSDADVFSLLTTLHETFETGRHWRQLFLHRLIAPNVLAIRRVTMKRRCIVVEWWRSWVKSKEQHGNVVLRSEMAHSVPEWINTNVLYMVLLSIEIKWDSPHKNCISNESFFFLMFLFRDDPLHLHVYCL